ncbi:phage baseplate assembly protein V, partial [Escherichia coli]
MSDANHPANLAELHRRIENLIRTGTVEEVKGDRVRIHTGELTTNWIPWLTLRAGDARTWWRPSTGEQVLLLCLSGELTTAVALPAIYSDANPAPLLDEQVHHSVYPDGAVIEYDPRSSALKATGIKTALVEASTRVTLDTPLVV